MTVKLSQKHVVHRSWRSPFPVIDHGEGIYLYDENGNRYIDSASGSSVVVNIGHGVQSVVEAMYEQGKKVTFAAPHLFTNEKQLELAEIVSEHAPGTMRHNCRTWFGTTGTDAVDSAVRLARLYFLAKGKPSKLVAGKDFTAITSLSPASMGTHSAANPITRCLSICPIFQQPTVTAAPLS
jgi:adenosylmethionine-8-amino-7-oxononanoate aminotransferase